MDLISPKELRKLTEYNNDVCVSIFITTSRSGKEVLEKQDSTQLKSKWNECKRTLENKGVNDTVIKNIETNIQKLLGDSDFWRHQSDGLAIFASKDFFENYTLPINFEENIYISKEFYLKPLAPVLSGDGKFYILSLQLKEVKFYEATRYSIGEIEIDEITPSNLRDRVGYDYEEKHLQWRSQQEGGGQAIFHGHGAGGSDHKDEIFRFYKAIDDGLDKLLNKEKAPLVIFCQDYMFPIYKEANTYNNLFDTPIHGNPNDVDLLGLHQRAVETVEPYLNEEEKKKLKKYDDTPLSEKSAAVHDIIPAAFQGKIDTLFLENREEIWGTYDEENMKVNIQDEQTSENTSLMNLAAIKVLENKGSVYLIEAESMPEKDGKMNALLRYS
tara:strand:+ start:79804 stop:80958 length:1155 start_codon:yes stop_codon:yes gene_type:complete